MRHPRHPADLRFAAVLLLAASCLTACSGGSDEQSKSGSAGVGASAAPRFVTTTSDLADLTRRIAGDSASVTSLLEAGKDPHIVEVRPDMARSVRDADVLVIVGRGNESQWLGDLLRLAGRDDLDAGKPRQIDASKGLTAQADSSEPAKPAGARGDHPLGDPHYLLDPVNGLLAAAHIRDRLAQLHPDQAETLNDNYAAFESQLLDKLVGPDLREALGDEAVMGLLTSDRLDETLEQRPSLPAVGGWLGAMKPYKGTAFIGDHEVWDAFARRFALRVAGYLEPAPGLDPTTQHLTQLADLVRTEHVPLILTCAKVPQKHARFLTEQTPIKLLLLTDQVGEEAEAQDYLSLFDYDIGRLTETLSESAPTTESAPASP